MSITIHRTVPLDLDIEEHTAKNPPKNKKAFSVTEQLPILKNLPFSKKYIESSENKTQRFSSVKLNCDLSSTIDSEPPIGVRTRRTQKSEDSPEKKRLFVTFLTIKKIKKIVEKASIVSSQCTAIIE